MELVLLPAMQYYKQRVPRGLCYRLYSQLMFPDIIESSDGRDAMDKANSLHAPLQVAPTELTATTGLQYYRQGVPRGLRYNLYSQLLFPDAVALPK